MKTPEEIKKGIECCCDSMGVLCPSCPYAENNFTSNTCQEEMASDALALTQQLEADKIRVLEESHEIRKDMLGKIQQLEAQVPRWIPVEERLPEHGRYLVAVKLTNRNTIKTATYNEHGWWIDLPAFDAEITHWMPLPEAPEEGN